MRITIEKNEQAFDLAAAERIVQQIKEKPESVIGLSTGRTTGNMHRLVAQIHRDRPFDASRTTFFGVDEVTGVPRSYSGACYTMLKTEIIDDNGEVHKILSGAEFKLYSDAEATTEIALVKEAEGVYRPATAEEKAVSGFQAATIQAGAVIPGRIYRRGFF